jgi:hypothetical protein
VCSTHLTQLKRYPRQYSIWTNGRTHLLVPLATVDIYCISKKGTSGWNRKWRRQSAFVDQHPHMFFVYFSRSNKGDAESIRRQPDLCLALFNCQSHKKKSSFSLSRSLHTCFRLFSQRQQLPFHLSWAGTKRAMENGQIAGQKPCTSSALAWQYDTSSTRDESRNCKSPSPFLVILHYCTSKSACTAYKRILLRMDCIA